MIDRCRLCGNALYFAGFDRKRNRVMACASSLMSHEEGKPTSVPCGRSVFAGTVKPYYMVNGVNVSEIRWFVEPFRPRRRR